MTKPSQAALDGPATPGRNASQHRLYCHSGLNHESYTRIYNFSYEQLRVEFADTPLAEYRVAYRRDHHHLRGVDPTRLYETRYQSPQLPLLELEPGDQQLVMELSQRRARRRSRGNMAQELLFPLEEVGQE